MRERLAAGFAAIAVAVIVVAGGLRLVALQNLLREETHTRLDEHAQVVAAVLDAQVAQGQPVSTRDVAPVLDRDARLELAPADGGRRLVLTGSEYDGDGRHDVTAVEDSLAGQVTLSARAGQPVDYYTGDLWSLLMLGALVALLAALAGWGMATRLSGPFTQLAGAAAALGRGRFDVALPDTRIPEARSIAEALRVSASQLEDRLSREREFAEHASHVLRTPLTGLRLELEDLTLRDDLPHEVTELAQRCLTRVDGVDAAADELVAITRRAALVDGPGITLEELARQVAQHWTDRLEGRRVVTAAVEGELSLRLTPGPLEQVLDLLLADVRGGGGPARLVFVGDEHSVRVRLVAGTLPAGPRAGVAAAGELVDAQGGRLAEYDDGTVEILLPRR